jgi:hypothetical protein
LKFYQKKFGSRFYLKQKHLQDIINELKSDKKVIIKPERKEHIDPSIFKAVLLCYYFVAKILKSAKNSKWKYKGRKLSSTNHHWTILGEGTDLQNANCLLSRLSIFFEGKIFNTSVESNDRR